MIGSLRGTVLERGDDGTVLLEVGGVGYFVSVTPRTLAELEPGSPAFVHVHHHIREDAQTLFGFRGRDERTTFQVLINTHGIGPALALAGGSGGGSTVVGDVREALAGLGYGPDEIRDALRELPSTADASTLLRDALKLLGAKRA